MALESQKSSRLEQPGAATLESIAGFWDRYGRVVLIGVAALVAVAAVAFFTLRSRARAEETASGRLAEATVLFWQGEYPRSLQLAKEVSAEYGATPSGLDAHRLAGDNAFWSGDFKTAITEYRVYLGKAKNGLLADAARRSLAYALESDRQFTEAAREYETLVGKFDRSSSAEFLAAAARCHRLANQPAEAIKRLERLTTEFGETPFADAARMQLAELSAAGR